ncbi:Cathepsin B [Schistosoma japonicum]|uniref:Cathepsin B-like cysteine proteinase n=4 Tax=Schistosoma japonicum TaxID=6182 RepID=C7TYR4_SCHJA|nr:Cathepsin B [Schistosoma japonicum]CAX76409.1 cathepsin B [Schistosoma japonicum]CAX82740.1 cathepsin B [Schistosoma japonicum]
MYWYNYYLLLCYIIILLICTLNENDARRHKRMHQPLSKELIHFINYEANTTWKAGPTRRFKTVSDIRRMLGALPDPNGEQLETLCTGYELTLNELPKSFDARKEWTHCPSISEIRDQSSCGSCWAFGAVEAMSDRICIESKGKYKPFLSAENLVSCCSSCGMGCNGGFPHSAWLYWKNQGIVTGDLYNTTNGCQPYEFPPCEHNTLGPLPVCDGDVETPPCKRTCQAGYNVSYENDKWYGKVVYRVKSNQEAIMKELMQHGPVEVDFEVYADFPNYKSGVYQHVSGALLGGHAVRLLGWGEENNVPYWLIANSWNTDWGDNGYFKIIRGKNECGIESDVNAGIPKIKK